MLAFWKLLGAERIVLIELTSTFDVTPPPTKYRIVKVVLEGAIP